MEKTKYPTYRPLPNSVTIAKSNIEGLGLIAKQEIKAGTCLGRTHHRVDDIVIRVPLGGFINHSNRPNCFISNTYSLWTIRDIKPREELTVYYRLFNKVVK